MADPDDLARAGRFLLDHGVYATPAFYPGVPRREVGFRLQLTAANTDQEVTQLLAVLDLLADTIPLRPAIPDTTAAPGRVPRSGGPSGGRPRPPS